MVSRYHGFDFVEWMSEREEIGQVVIVSETRNMSKILVELQEQAYDCRSMTKPCWNGQTLET